MSLIALRVEWLSKGSPPCTGFPYRTGRESLPKEGAVKKDAKGDRNYSLTFPIGWEFPFYRPRGTWGKGETGPFLTFSVCSLESSGLSAQLWPTRGVADPWRRRVVSQGGLASFLPLELLLCLFFLENGDISSLCPQRALKCVETFKLTPWLCFTWS